MTSLVKTTIISLLLFCVEIINAGEILDFTFADLRELEASRRELDLEDKQTEFTALYFDIAGKFEMRTFLKRILFSFSVWLTTH